MQQKYKSFVVNGNAAQGRAWTCQLGSRPIPLPPLPTPYRTATYVLSPLPTPYRTVTYVLSFSSLCLHDLSPAHNYLRQHHLSHPHIYKTLILCRFFLHGHTPAYISIVPLPLTVPSLLQRSHSLPTSLVCRTTEHFIAIYNFYYRLKPQNPRKSTYCSPKVPDNATFCNRSLCFSVCLVCGGPAA